jgi:putative transposase
MARPSLDSRARLVRSLRKLERHGRLTGWEIRSAARALDISERTVRRWLQADLTDLVARPGPRPYQLTEADRDALADWRGSVAAAWRAQRAAGAPLPALRTFQQAVRRQLLPAQRAALADGVEGRRRHAVYLRWEADYRNQIWEADHKRLPVLVLAPKAKRPRPPWVTWFVDAYSRLVMGWAISLHPSSATSLTALRMGLVVDPERGPWGGVPTMLRWDNGLEFAATALTKAAAALGCVVSPTPPYTPHLKGKVERLHRTITQEFLTGLPFYTRGPRAADRTLYGPAVGPMTLDRFVSDFDAWVQEYNTARPHRGIGGQTPLERWSADATPIEQVPADQLRGMLLADEERTIGKDGIHFRRLVYVAPELNGRVGQRVIVHYMPHDTRQIELRLGDGWVTAKPQGLLTAAERDQVLARRRADAAELARRQRRASRRARLRLAPITGPGPIEETTVVSRQQAAADDLRRTDQDLRRLARVDLLNLAAGWEDLEEEEHDNDLEGPKELEVTMPPPSDPPAATQRRRQGRVPSTAHQRPGGANAAGGRGGRDAPAFP